MDVFFQQCILLFLLLFRVLILKVRVQETAQQADKQTEDIVPFRKPEQIPEPFRFPEYLDFILLFSFYLKCGESENENKGLGKTTISRLASDYTIRNEY